MAGLIGEAMSRDVQRNQKRVMATQAASLPDAIEQVASQMQSSPGDDRPTPEPARKHGTRQVCRAATAVAGELPGGCRPAKAATILRQRVKRVPLRKLRWNVSVAGMVTTLVI